MKILGYVLVALALLCIPFAARQALLGLTTGSEHFMTCLGYVLAGAVLAAIGLFILKKFDDPTSTSRRYANASSRIKIG